MNNKINILTGTLAIVFCFSLCGCSSRKKDNKEDKTIAVNSITASHATEYIYRDYIGTVEEEVSAALSFPVQGCILSINVREGQKVLKGTLLAELETGNLKSIYDAALATLRQAEDAMSRLQELYDNESLPEIKYIEVQTQLEQAKASEQIARKNLEDSRIFAPFDGIVGSKKAEVGENAAPHQTILTLLRINNVKVKTPIPEKEIADIVLNSTANIEVNALKGKKFIGRIVEKGIVADPVSHTYDTRISVANHDGDLLPGMVCKVFIGEGNTQNYISVPNKCIQFLDAGRKYVWIAEDGKAVKREITTGQLTRDGVIVISGLSGGEQVITGGCHKLYEGVKVRVL